MREFYDIHCTHHRPSFLYRLLYCCCADGRDLIRCATAAGTMIRARLLPTSVPRFAAACRHPQQQNSCHKDLKEMRRRGYQSLAALWATRCSQQQQLQRLATPRLIPRRCMGSASSSSKGRSYLERWAGIRGRVASGSETRLEGQHVYFL